MLRIMPSIRANIFINIGAPEGKLCNESISDIREKIEY